MPKSTNKCNVSVISRSSYCSACPRSARNYGIDSEHQTKRKQNAIAKRQALYDQRQKIGNQMITGQFKGRNSMQLRAVKTGEDTVVTDPQAELWKPSQHIIPPS